MKRLAEIRHHLNFVCVLKCLFMCPKHSSCVPLFDLMRSVGPAGRCLVDFIPGLIQCCRVTNNVMHFSPFPSFFSRRSGASNNTPQNLTLLYIRSLAEGVQGAITGIPNFTATHPLFADDLSLTSTDHNELQTVLDKLRVYAQKKSLTVNTQSSEVMCFNCRPYSFLPPLFFDGVQPPATQTSSNILVWCATDR